MLVGESSIQAGLEGRTMVLASQTAQASESDSIGSMELKGINKIQRHLVCLLSDHSGISHDLSQASPERLHSKHHSDHFRP